MHTSFAIELIDMINEWVEIPDKNKIENLQRNVEIFIEKCYNEGVFSFGPHLKPTISDFSRIIC